ncbi:4-hydroxy-3-methylbut-2-enyl diphosphate reductase [Candidatus Sumerlaeota bacterium]|nr:4-hydroxy-3-methylbut-2-enyl diphosphate reductase [Candidatus Sumerlaeota bacterium]
MKTEPNYFRASLGMKQEIAPAIAADYHSGIVDWMRANGNMLSLDGITFRLAKEFGFCYGVDKAVDMAYETRMKFPDRRIFLTYEIIHNPSVNNRLKKMGIQFLSGALKGELTFDDIGADDVVIMPAFGVPTDYLEQLRAKGSVLVDTTCGSVIHVWKRVEKYAKDGYTSLVHGKALHAETLATVSQAQKVGGHTIVVLDKAQAQLVCDVITGDAPREAILQLGPMSLSRNFDPQKHIGKIGVANQTTMLANESLEIAAMIGAAMEKRYGKENLAAHFRSFDTICSATQERQDAIVDLVKSGEIDMMLVIGGYNSSNTGHLLDIAAQALPAWHISDAGEIVSSAELRHQPAHQKERVIARSWLPTGNVSIGLTAGASTPNKAIGEVIERVAELRGAGIPEAIANFVRPTA